MGRSIYGLGWVGLDWFELGHKFQSSSVWLGRAGSSLQFFFSKSLLNAVESLQRIICTARGYDISFRLQV